MTRISSEDVSKVAKLARLDIPEDRLEIYAIQLEKILDYVAQLEEVDTQNVQPTTRAVEVTNVLMPPLGLKSPLISILFFTGISVS